MLNLFYLAMKLLWREWRAREWVITFIALLLSIVAITTLHFYIDRLMRGLDQQSAKLLGGDLIISSPSPIPPNWRLKAQALGLRTAEVWTFPSVVNANGKMQLANLQAVSNTYPLFGEKKSFLNSHDIWIEPRLLSLLSIKINDQITIGAATFHVANVLTSDLDTLNTGWTIAPRIMLRLEDVPATKIILPGSRVDYRLLLAGETLQLKNFRLWIKPFLSPGQRLFDINNQRFTLHKTIENVQTYLQLVLLVCLSMSGVAISLSTQQYLRRHYSHVALWRCLGAKKNEILLIFLIQFLVIISFAGIIGILIGYFMQEILVILFKDFLQFPLPPVNLELSYLGFITSALLLFAFAYPVISDLPSTSPLYIWRNDITYTRSKIIYYISSILMLVLFVYWMMNFSNLSLLFIDVFLLSVAWLYIFSILLLRLINLIINKMDGALKQGLNFLIRHPQSTSIQLTGFSLILTFILLLGMARTNLITNWQQSLPKNTPNYFAINIAPHDITELKNFFKKEQISLSGIYPIVRGRLFALNGKPIMNAIPQSAHQHNALHRELNLSAMLHFPSDNIITQGRSWSSVDTKKALVSVEKNLAEDLHLRLGDQLSFQIGDQVISAIIVNFRSIDWESFHPNFYMIFPQNFLDSYPTTYITSFHLNPDQTLLLNQLITIFPNITVIDVANILAQIQILIEKMSMAIQYLFLFSLGSGILIFLASLQASMDERRQTYHLFHILGASKQYIYKSLFVEFTCLSLIIFTVSMVLAKIIVYLLMKTFFNL